MCTCCLRARDWSEELDPEIGIYHDVSQQGKDIILGNPTFNSFAPA